MLLTNGHAYIAFDTSEEIESMRQKQQQEGNDPKYDRSIMKNQLTLGDPETKKMMLRK